MDSDELKQQLGLLADIKQCCCASQLVMLTLACFAVFNSHYGTQMCPHSNTREFREVIRDVGERTVSGLDSEAKQWLLG